MTKSLRLFGLLLVGLCGALAAESIGGKDPARAARSVHLKWTAPECAAFYLETTVEQSARGSYFMACGWSGGYFGIQELTGGTKVAIFSVWDLTKGDDPKAVKVEDRVEILHEGEGVRIKRFGGEGTGGQCLLDFPWAVGQTCRFLVRAEAQGEKTVYSGWLFDPRTKAWRLLVTMRTRSGGKLLRGLYSFVEDFRRDGRSAEEARQARFFNGWTRSTGGDWQPANAARFTASRADWEARDTINASVGERGFILVTGGATKREHELDATLTFPVSSRRTAPPTDIPESVWVSLAGAAGGR